MMRLLACAPLVAVLLVGAITPALATHTAATALNTNEQLLRDNVRAHRGYLSTHSELNHIAHSRAAELERQWKAGQTPSHAGFWEALASVEGCWNGTIAELIGWVEPEPVVSYTAAGAYIISSWHASPSHEPLLHEDRFDRMGVGVVGDAYRGRFYVLWLADKC